MKMQMISHELKMCIRAERRNSSKFDWLTAARATVDKRERLSLMPRVHVGVCVWVWGGGGGAYMLLR